MNRERDAQKQVRFRFHAYMLSSALIWTLVMGASLGATLFLDYRALGDLGLAEARTTHDFLVSNSPLLMARPLHGMGSARIGLRGRITSLQARSTANAPDDWERRALLKLEAGAEEISEITSSGGLESLRLIRPLRVEPACLACHGGQDFQPGETRGGISVTVPLASLQAAHQPRVQLALIGYALLWLIGLFGLVTIARILRRHALENLANMAVFRELFDGAPVAYHELNLDGVIVRVNEAECELLGFSESEILGRHAWELIAGVDREVSRQAVAGKLSGAQALVPVQRHYVRRDGRELVLEIRDRLVKNSAGVTTGIRSLLLDVTERTKAEDALRESERSYRRQFSENSAVMLLINPLNGQIVDVNGAATRFYGYEREQFLGMQISKIDPLPEIVIREMQATLTTREGKCFQVRHWLADGTPREVEVSLSLIQLGGGSIVHTIVFDVTARTKAEAELKSSREQYALAIDGSNDGIWDWDIRNNTHFRSARWAEMLGFADSELPATGAAFDERLHPDDKDRVLGELDRYLRGEIPAYQVEYRIRRKDDSYLWVMAKGAALRDENGEAYRMAGSHSDITDRKRSEESITRYLHDLEQARAEQERNAAELLVAKEAAEAANRAKSEFLANMSHEIRTPMNGVLGMAELALGTDLNAEQHDYISMVKTSGESLLAVINDILDFSKIEAGKLELDPVDFCLRDRLVDALRVVAPRAHSKDVELACDVDENVPEMVRGDSVRLRQVLLNLFSNAVKFTAKGEVVLTVTMDGDLVQFSVRDTGIGIPLEQQAHVFQPFCQADSSTTRKFGGTGLGLSICRQLVTLMGGRIWLESEPGHGTTVSFTTRFAPATSLPPRSVETLPGPDGIRILVVDDNATNRRILQRQLERWGGIPSMAAGGAEALDLLQATDSPFGLIITDCHMPEMDGFQFVAELHSRWPSYQNRVLMLSSASSAGDAARCHAIGVSRHVIKPVKEMDLLDAIRRLMNDASALANLSHAVRVAAPAGPKPPVASLRVLLAEDNMVNQRVAQRMLERLGHSVRVTNTGAEAVAAWQPGLFDLVLMDVQMPEMDGFEATAAIRARGGDTPIIALTAHAMAGDRERCLRQGMDGYLQKPIQSKELAAILDSCSATKATQG